MGVSTLTITLCYHSYLVCILFGMPSLQLVTFKMFFILVGTGLSVQGTWCRRGAVLTTRGLHAHVMGKRVKNMIQIMYDIT